MIELLRSRRSIRAYAIDKIEPDKIELLKESVLRAPSSRGINPWKFIFVKEKRLLKKLASAKEHGGEFLESAALGVVICADESKSDVWVEDCSIASIVLQLAAHSMGLGSCWVQIRNRMHDKALTAETFIKDLFELTKSIRVESIIAIGYPAEKKRSIAKDKLQYEKIEIH